jgi:hypothetical protein
MITFVATAYQEYYDPYMFISSLLLQTNPNWKCIVYCDGPNEHIQNIVNQLKDPRVSYTHSETNTGIFGHFNRADSVNRLIDTEFFIQTSIQDYYLPNTVEMLINETKDYDFIYFNCLHNHYNYDILNTSPNVCKIDWGCYAVRTSIGKAVGITEPENGVCDGIFAEALVEYPGVRVKKIDKILTVHN